MLREAAPIQKSSDFQRLEGVPGLDRYPPQVLVGAAVLGSHMTSQNNDHKKTFGTHFM